MTASPYIAVVGGVNIDIGGRSDAPLVAGDSNPGRIRSSLGGVGRNIAHNLALLGAKVKLITALGADDGAKRIEASCADLGIDLTDSLYVPDGATSTYLFLADSNGDMALAMNDMAIYEHLTPAFLETKLAALFALWGYDEVVTPTIEYFDTLTMDSGRQLAPQLFKLFDKGGKTLALRHEMTTPIARVTGRDARGRAPMTAR